MRRLAAVLGGLGRCFGNGVAAGDALLADHDDLPVEVIVDPVQPGRLAAAQSAECDQSPHSGARRRFQAVAAQDGAYRGR
jgi:hypothetical protein